MTSCSTLQHLQFLIIMQIQNEHSFTLFFNPVKAIIPILFPLILPLIKYNHWSFFCLVKCFQFSIKQLAFLFTPNNAQIHYFNIFLKNYFLDLILINKISKDIAIYFFSFAELSSHSFLLFIKPYLFPSHCKNSLYPTLQFFLTASSEDHCLTLKAETTALLVLLKTIPLQHSTFTSLATALTDHFVS